MIPAAIHIAAANDEIISSAVSLIFGLAASAACAYGCWYFAKNSGRNEALAIVWGIMCGVAALLVYLVLYSQDSSRRRAAQTHYYPGGYPEYGQQPYPQYPTAPFPAAAPAAVPGGAGGRYCPRCGAIQVPGAVFCEHCGERIPGIEPQPPADGSAGPPRGPGSGPVVNIDTVTAAADPPHAPQRQPVPPPPPPAPPRPSEWK